MKYLKITFLWLCAAFITSIPVSILISYLEPVPTLNELTKVEGVLADYSIWRKKVGKGPRCGISLLIESEQKNGKEVQVHCNDRTESLENRKDEYLEIWLQPHKWYQFEKDDYSIFHMQIGNEIFIDYAVMAPRYESSKWLLLIVLIVAIGFVVFRLPFLFTESLRVWKGDSQPIEKGEEVRKSERYALLVTTVSEGQLNINVVKSLEVKATLAIVFIMASCFLLASLFFTYHGTGGGLAFFLLGIIFLFVLFMFLNPEHYFIAKETKLITRKDHFCGPVLFDDLGAISKLSIYKYKAREGAKHSYHLVAECINGQIELFGWKYLPDLEALRQEISDFIGVETKEEVREIGKLADLKQGSSKHFAFLSDLPGFILMGLMCFGLFLGLVI